MARKKKPENETAADTEERRVLEFISNIASRSEKTSWNRKMDNMVKELSLLPAIEEKIFKIMFEEKQPVLDRIAVLRTTMIQECVHPYDQLLLKEDHVVCKFCNCRMGIPNVSS